jgi:hypothetical protein
MLLWEEFKAKATFWYVRRYFKLNKQYTFMFDVAKPDCVAIKLMGKYDGVIVEFGNIKINDDGLLNFDFDVIANPNLKDTKSKKFLNFTSNVMRSIIINSIESAEKLQNEDRKIDTVESDDERELHEESSSLSERRVSKRKPRKKVIRGNKTVHP